MTRESIEKANSELNQTDFSRRQPFWKFDRDLTNAMSNEASAGRQPVADQHSPVADLPAADDPGSPPRSQG